MYHNVELETELENAVWDNYMALRCTSGVAAKMGTTKFQRMILDDIQQTGSERLLLKFVYYELQFSNEPPSDHPFIIQSAAWMFHRWMEEYEKSQKANLRIGQWIFSAIPPNDPSYSFIARLVFNHPQYPTVLRREAAKRFEPLGDSMSVEKVVEHLAFNGRCDGLRQLFLQGDVDLTLELSQIMRDSFAGMQDLKSDLLPFWADTLVEYDEVFLEKLYRLRGKFLQANYADGSHVRYLEDVNRAISIFLKNWS